MSNGIRAIYEAFEIYGGGLAPVFEAAYPSEDMADLVGAEAECPDGFSNGGGFSTAGGGGNAYYYHVVGFVVVKGDPADKNNHVVYGEFQYKVLQGGIDITGYGGTGTCSPLLHGIALWE
jgi:hypothetical protein